MKNKKVIKKVNILSVQFCKHIKGGGVILTIDDDETEVD